MAINKYLAETVGTFILVFLGSMSILAGVTAGGPLMVVIPLGFGLALLVAIASVGHVSGGHFNPAVTLAMWFDRRTSFSDLVGYLIGQFVGATLASAVVLIATEREAVAATITRHQDAGTGFLMELLLTLVFVLVILASTRVAPVQAPLLISLALAAVHFAGVPFSGASVNPARSFAPALVGGEFSGLWVYLLAPLAGGAVAWSLWRMFGVEPETVPPPSEV